MALIFTGLAVANAIMDKAKATPPPQQYYKTYCDPTSMLMDPEMEETLKEYTRCAKNKYVMADIFNRLDKFMVYYPHIAHASCMCGWNGLKKDGKIDEAIVGSGYSGAWRVENGYLGMLCVTYGKLSQDTVNIYKRTPMYADLLNCVIDQSLLPDLACFQPGYEPIKFRCYGTIRGTEKQ